MWMIILRHFIALWLQFGSACFFVKFSKLSLTFSFIQSFLLTVSEEIKEI